jgi:K(+)-stimulated pyrophosphate-energized sodium pump
MSIRRLFQAAAALATLMLLAGSALASEADLVVPPLDDPAIKFLGMTGHQLLLAGLGVCALGLLFGLAIYQNLKKLPVHSSMREISELIYETCKTYLSTQGKFLMLLWVFIGAVIVAYFGVLKPVGWDNVAIIMAFSLVGIAGSYGVAWFGIRVNTFANSRTAFAALAGKPFPCYAIPLKAGISIGTMLIAIELLTPATTPATRSARPPTASRPTASPASR